jgi:hypothetical protein
MENPNDKIINYILERNIKNNLNEMPNKGYNDVELNFQLASNDKVPGKTFVVYERLRYYNSSLKDRKCDMLAFDEKGDLIPDFDKKGGCYFGFFDDLKIIKNIV